MSRSAQVLLPCWHVPSMCVCAKQCVLHLALPLTPHHPHSPCGCSRHRSDTRRVKSASGILHSAGSAALPLRPQYAWKACAMPRTCVHVWGACACVRACSIHPVVHRQHHACRGPRTRTSATHEHTSFPSSISSAGVGLTVGGLHSPWCDGFACRRLWKTTILFCGGQLSVELRGLLVRWVWRFAIWPCKGYSDHPPHLCGTPRPAAEAEDLGKGRARHTAVRTKN